MPMQIFQCMLCHNARRMEIRSVQDDLQDQINTGETVLKHGGHKDIIHQRKTLNDFPIARTPCFLCIKCHRIPPLLYCSRFVI